MGNCLWRSIVALATTASLAMVACAGQLTVAEHGREAEYSIVVPEKASPSQKYAAEELRDFTEKATGVCLPIVTDATPIPAKAIVLGGADAMNRVPPGTDGFRLKVDGSRLYIIGATARGVLYGVYELLETYGGCGWFASWHEVVPHLERFEVPDDLNVSEAPAFALREPFWKDAFEPDFAARLRINGNRAELSAKHGGKPFRYHRTLGIAHTFEQMVPCDRYFGSHPEYFCEIDGQRQRLGKMGQLCLTNPDVLGIVVSNVLAAIAEDPGVRIVGVSQNDNNRYCRCAKCAAIDSEEGSSAGTMIRFVNAVAARVAERHPNVLVQTLAYMHTRKPPRVSRPLPNVVPCLCSIECDFSTPLAEGAFPDNKAFAEDLRGWSEISRQLLIWNYCTDFYHYLKPFPNIPVMQPNLKLFRDCRVCGVMEQGAYQGWHGEFAELKAYLQAKWLWNPELDEKVLLDRFFTGYYGKAAPHVRAYFDLLVAEARSQKGRPLKIFDALDGGISFSDDFCEKAAELWRKAEASVADDPSCTYNVKTSAMPIDYLRYSRHSKTVRLVRNAADFRPLDVAVAQRLDSALRLAEQKGRNVQFCEEWGRSGDRRGKIAVAASGKVRIVGDGNRAVLEEDMFALLRGREHLSVRDDAEAGNGKALRLENNHADWYAQGSMDCIQFDPGVKYRLRVRAKVELKPDAEGEAFSFGIWNHVAKRKVAARSVSAKMVKGMGYVWYDGFEFSPEEGCLLWVAPGIFNRAKATASHVHNGVWIDCVEIARIGDF